MPHVEIPQAEFKVVMLGDTNTGKTCLVLRFAEGYYREEGRSSTIGAFFLTKRLTVNSITCKMLLWDTAGKEQFHKLAQTYYKNAAAAILCYDISNPCSLVRLRGWLKEVQESTGQIVLAIAACKGDLEPVPGLPEEAQSLADSVGALYVHTSAKDNEGVSELFQLTAERVLTWQQKSEKGMAIPLPVTLGAATNRSRPGSPPNFTRISSIEMETPIASSKMKDTNESYKDITTAEDNDILERTKTTKRPRLGCAGSLLACGSDDPTRSCNIS
jgi:small GTP-binding protein